MHRLEIYQTGEVYTFPSELSEFNADQWLYVVGLWLKIKAGFIDYDSFKMALTIKLLDIKKTPTFKNLSTKADKDKVYENLSRLTSLIDDMFPTTTDDDGKEIRKINLSTPKNYLPEIKFKGKKYYGPADALSDCSWYEYRTACYLYENFIKSQEEKDLDLLFAFLYRPGKWPYFFIKNNASYNGIRRVNINAESNPLLLKKRAKLFAKLPLDIKYSVMLFMDGTLNFLRNGKPDINGKEIDLSILYDNKEIDDKDIGLTGLLYSLAESNVFGDVKTVDAQNLYFILARMYQVVVTNNKLKEELEAKKNANK